MAVPKGKQSKSRTNKRFANYKATAPTLVECPHCHSLKEAHRVCAIAVTTTKLKWCPRTKKKLIKPYGLLRQSVFSFIKKWRAE